MDDVLILQCDKENRMFVMAERIYNMKRLIELPDEGDDEFISEKVKWKNELTELEQELP